MNAPAHYFAPGSPLRARLDALLQLVPAKAEGGEADPRMVLSLLLAETVRQVQADAGAEAQELRTALEAWQNQFGTTQLTHAIAKHEAELAALRQELAPLREAVGVRADAASSPEDLANWARLMERADRAFVAEVANARLRQALETFANPEYWTDRSPGLQWFGKRNPLDFAKAVLKDAEIPRLASVTMTGYYVVEGLDYAHRWVPWHVTEEGKVLNPCATLADARKLKADLDSYRAEGKSGWRDSRIVFVSTTRQLVPEDQS